MQEAWFSSKQDLLNRLECLRGSKKTVGEVAPTLMNWVSIFSSPVPSPTHTHTHTYWTHLASQRHNHVSAPEHRASSFCTEQFPCLEAYVTYCCNQVEAKALLDHKKNVKPVEKFLRLCQESSFSRKLDLWNFLDLPRSRLVKYPLLLKEIQKCTPAEHPDEFTLPDAVSD